MSYMRCRCNGVFFDKHDGIVWCRLCHGFLGWSPDCDYVHETAPYVRCRGVWIGRQCQCHHGFLDKESFLQFLGLIPDNAQAQTQTDKLYVRFMNLLRDWRQNLPDAPDAAVQAPDYIDGADSQITLQMEPPEVIDSDVESNVEPSSKTKNKKVKKAKRSLHSHRAEVC